MLHIRPMKNLCLYLLVFSLAACRKQNDEILIRVKNDGSLNLENVVVFTLNPDNREQAFRYGNIASQAVSRYLSHSRISAQPGFQYRLPNGDQLDFRFVRCANVPASPGPGKYTLVLDTDSSGNPSFRYITD